MYELLQIVLHLTLNCYNFVAINCLLLSDYTALVFHYDIVWHEWAVYFHLIRGSSRCP